MSSIMKGIVDEATITPEDLQQRLKATGLKFVPFNEGSLIVNYEDRMLVLVDINGIHIPFYISTGRGGKEKVASGKWYPIFGIESGGWINKGDQDSINAYYGNPLLKAVAQKLDSNLGDLRDTSTDVIPTMWFKKNYAIINRDLSPASNKDVAAVWKNINATLNRLGTPMSADPKTATSPPKSNTAQQFTYKSNNDVLLLQIAELSSTVVDPDSGTVTAWDPETVKRLDAYAQKNPTFLKKLPGSKPISLKEEEKDMSSIMKGIVDEGEEVAVIYIDGKPSVKYAKKHEAEADAARMRERHPNKKIEIKHEVRETEAKKGADGKRCWKGKRYAGTENGKDKCIPVKEGDVVPFKKKTDKDKYNTAIAKQRGPLPISYIDPDAGIAVKSIKPGDSIQIPDEYQDINLKSKVRGVPKQNQTNFEVWGNDHGYYVFGNNTNAVLSAWPNGEMMVLSDPSDPKGRENCQRFAKQVMKPIELDSLRPKLKNKIVQKMSMIDQPMNEGVIVGHDANDPEVAVLGGAGTMSLSRLKKKAHGEALQLADDIANGKYSASSYNMKQLHNTLNTIVAAEEEMKKKYFGEDYTGEFATERTVPVTNAGLPERQFRGAISETPTDNPTGASGEGGWRKYKPKSAGEIEEGQIYSTGGGCGQSYRKFTPKSAGTFEEEQLDEKCWDTHKQVGMKKKGDKMVPNCVPKESAIMKGLKLS